MTTSSELVRIERERFRDQLARLDEEVIALERAEPDDPGAAFVLAQARRDRTRLAAAAQGRTPSAVLGRDGAGRSDAELRRALARAESAHAADAVLAFLGRGDEASGGTGPGENLVRAARWLLRLELELHDAGFEVESEPPGELALRVVRAPSRSAVDIERLSATVRRWRDALGDD